MNNWIELLADFKQKKQPVAVVTITKVLGSAPCKIGAKMIVESNKKIHGTIGGGKLEFEIIDKAVEVIKTNKSATFDFTLGPAFEQCCGGKVELIIEPMNQAPELYIFGAGHIGVAICAVLKDTPFQIHLCDTRPDWRSQVEIDRSINFMDINFDLYKQQVHWGANTYIIILTHDHKLDFEITALALEQETKFIGLIGSKTKRQKFHNTLVKDLNFEQGMNPVKCPVGLDLGGNTPKEIAISVAAELLQIHYGK